MKRILILTIILGIISPILWIPAQFLIFGEINNEKAIESHYLSAVLLGNISGFIVAIFIWLSKKVFHPLALALIIIYFVSSFASLYFFIILGCENCIYENNLFTLAVTMASSLAYEAFIVIALFSKWIKKR